jgi:Kdo2-lipid IVA lauroyltransferase/acyltransferase
VRRLRHTAEYVAVRTLRAGVRLLPMRAVRTCGHALGSAAYVFQGRRRRIALDNVARAFPEKAPADRRALARAVFAHFGAVLLELLVFTTLPRERMRQLVEIDGAEHFRSAQGRGRGVLFFTGHFGYWEMFAIVHAFVFEPVSVLARPLDNPLLHRMLEDVRASTGNAVIYRQGAIRKVLRDLSENRGVAILIDQHLHGAEAVQVEFFGRPAATTSALAALALRTGAVVMPVFALPLPGGRYRFVYESAVEPPSSETADAVNEFTQRCTDVLEKYVRRHPELWLWMHRRWREENAARRDAGLSFDEAGADLR